MKWIVRFVVGALVGVMVVAGCGLFSPEGFPRALTEEESKLVNEDYAFGFKLFREIVATAEDTANIFISPLSVAMALGMTYNGARGETQEAMQATLELSEMSLQEVNESYCSLIDLLREADSKVDFRIANSIWYRDDFTVKDEFIDLSETYFDAVVRALDFDDPASVDVINDWVKENTNGKIEEIIDGIGPLTVMYLIDAIYFKGIWEYEFPEDSTRADSFQLADGSFVPCEMMRLTDSLSYFENELFQAVDLSYGNGCYGMVVILPWEGVDLDSLIEGMDQAVWDEWMAGFSEDEVVLEMPKFTLEYGLTLNDVLTALGMGIAFDEERADFSGISEEQVWIDSVLHKTFVQVDEEGTEAAGVAVVVLEREVLRMRVDRPFMFVIWERNSGVILFMGRLTRPVWGE